MDVTWEPLTAFMFQSTLPLRYRVVGRVIHLLHTIEDLVGGGQAELDQRRDWLESLGHFDRAVLEDIGVRDSIFDVATADPERVLRVCEIVAAATNPDHAEAVVLWLDVMDFRLTEALHAATTVCLSATYGEQASQGATSCRRFLKQLADVLFLHGTKLTTTARLIRSIGSIDLRRRSRMRFPRERSTNWTALVHWLTTSRSGRTRESTPNLRSPLRLQ